MPAPTGNRMKEPCDAFDPRPSSHHGAVFDLPAVADLLARQHELQDQRRDRLDDDAVATRADAPALQAHLHRRELVFRLYQLAGICRPQHHHLDLGGAAGSLRVFALPLPRRQASVLLAAVEPHGAGRGLCTAVLQPLFGDRAVRYALGGRARALHLQRPLAVWILEGFVSGVPREIDETAFLDGYSFPRFFIKILVPLIASGIGVAAFFCFMFSWVELLLARTLTSVSAKPIAAIMTRTVSAAGMDWGLLAAAGVLTIIPGALVIWFVRNYIASGFALGRV